MKTCNCCKKDLPYEMFTFTRNRFTARCKPCLNKEQIKRRKAKRLEILAAMGNACVRCGFDDKRILQVHHVGHNGSDPEEQSMSSNPGKLLKNVISRPGEYELLCPNCHTLHHYICGTQNRIVSPEPNSLY